MIQSKNFEKVKNYYLLGLWDEQKVYNAVDKWITTDEYKLIIGKPFESR